VRPKCKFIADKGDDNESRDKQQEPGPIGYGMPYIRKTKGMTQDGISVSLTCLGLGFYDEAVNEVIQAENTDEEKPKKDPKCLIGADLKPFNQKYLLHLTG
jgi:hypothetical protein